MSLNIWLAFVAVVFVVSGSPGPNMLLSLTHGIHYGLTRTFSTMLGLLSGLAVILAISLCGLGAVLVASTTAFEVVKYVGAAYLVYLGIRTWRTVDTRLVTEGHPPAAGGSNRYRTGVLVSLSNPKAILFCVALFPQFIDRRQALAPQAGILLATFVCIETCWMFVYAGGGARLAAWLRQGNRMRWFNRASGGVFIGAGVLLGSLRR
ncbi:MAG TPA: LysE family translocator [Steroidobacteraceae bacterium]|nr:LysE family translocator [Steroidobacteraceae bacterium]